MIGSRRKRVPILGMSTVALAIFLSACGATAYGSSQAASPRAAASAGQAQASPAVTAGDKAPQLGTQSIPGIGAVLVNSAGRTLYHLTTDTSTMTTCTGGCAQVWPPLLAANGVPPSSPGSGASGTIQRPDGGKQVTFKRMLLYTYAGDPQPGQANGQGIGGTWFAVTP